MCVLAGGGGMEERLLEGKEKQEKLSCNVESLWSVCTNHTGSVPTPGQPLGRCAHLQEMTLRVSRLCAKLWRLGVIPDGSIGKRSLHGGRESVSCQSRGAGQRIHILFLSQNIWIKEHLLLLCPLKTMQYFSGWLSGSLLPS